MAGKRDLSDIISLLTVCGFFNSKKGIWNSTIKITQPIRLLISIIGVVITAASMYLSGIKESVPRFAFFFFCGFSLTTQAIYFWRNQNNIMQTVYSLKTFIQKRNEPQQIELFRKASSLVWFGLKGLIYICLWFQATYYFIPMGYDVYLAVYTNSSKPFTLPMPNKGIVATEQRSISFYLLTFFIIIWSYVATGFMVGYYTLLFALIIYTCSELKIISDSIQAWGKSYQENKKLEDPEASLRSIIQDHQDVLILTEKVRDVIAFAALVNNTLGPMLLTIFLFTIVVEIKKNLILVVFNLVCLMSMTSLLFSSCLAGEILQIQSMKIFEQFYETPWYEMPPQLRVTLNMIIRQAARPMSIHYKRRGNLNLQLFMQIINSSYSYFMLLNSMR